MSIRALLLYVLFLFHGPVQPVATGGRVVAVRDGDTIGILDENRTVTIRLAHIDCPEKGQPFGTRAKQFTASLCYGRHVTIRPTGETDRYGRVIAEVITDEEVNVDQELVRAGLAWHFTKYSKDQHYAALQAEARRNKIGLWADAAPVAPWDWRKRGRRVRAE